MKKIILEQSYGTRFKSEDGKVISDNEIIGFHTIVNGIVCGVIQRGKNKEVRGGHGEGSYSEPTYYLVKEDYSLQELNNGDVLDIL